jgi:hypothetical protein
MVNLSAVLFVLGMAGLGLVVTLYELDQDRLHQAAVAAFSERVPAMPVSNFHHVDNSKYLREAAGCIFVLALAAIVRYRAPRKIRVAERVRVVEKWMQTPARRQRGSAEQVVAKRREQAARVKPQPELSDRLSAVVWGDRVAHKERMAG